MFTWENFRKTIGEINSYANWWPHIKDLVFPQTLDFYATQYIGLQNKVPIHAQPQVSSAGTAPQATTSINMKPPSKATKKVSSAAKQKEKRSSARLRTSIKVASPPSKHFTQLNNLTPLSSLFFHFKTDNSSSVAA